MEAYFRSIRKQIIHQIESADKEINIAVAWFTNLELFTSICNRLNQGVKVNLIIINDYINNGEYGLNFQNFIDKGGNLFYGMQERPVHHKFCIIDNKVLINGSYNWTYYAESRNEENVIITKDTKVVNQYLSEFRDLQDKLDRVETVVRIDFSELRYSDLFSLKEYISIDYFLRGKERNEPELIKRAIAISPDNEEISKDTYLTNSDISKLNKKLEQSIGVHIIRDGKEDQYYRMIKAKTEIPIESRSKFTIREDYQEFANIKVGYGEKKLFSQNTQIAHFKLRLQPQLRKDAKEKILIVFNINSIGILSVTVTDTKNQNILTMKYDISFLIT
jgi:hypothetical protein